MCVAAHKPKAKHIQTKDLLQALNLEIYLFMSFSLTQQTHWGVFITSKTFFFGPLMLYMLWLPDHPTQNELVAALAEEPSAKG